MTHLARFIRLERLRQNISLGQLARMVGYRNLSKGANRLHRFEFTGKIRQDLLEKVIAALKIDMQPVEELVLKDRDAWEQRANELVPMRLIVRFMTAVYCEQPLPAEITTQEAAVEYACQFARQHRLRCCLAVSRRLSIYFDQDGRVERRIVAQLERFGPIKPILIASHADLVRGNTGIS